MSFFKKMSEHKMKPLRTIAFVLIALACLSSLLAYFFLPYEQAEPFYMMALVFTFMAVYCLARHFF